MKVRQISVLSALLTLACSPTETTEQRAIMDKLDRSIKLPADARPFSDYARYYKRDPDVGGLYIRLIIGCDVPGPTFGCKKPFDLKRGRRRWLRENDYLGPIGGGGCDVVNIWFDGRDIGNAPTFCNGPE